MSEPANKHRKKASTGTREFGQRYAWPFPLEDWPILGAGQFVGRIRRCRPVQLLDLTDISPTFNANPDDSELLYGESLGRQLDFSVIQLQG